MKKRYILGLGVIGLVGCDQKQPPKSPPPAPPAPTQQTAPAPAPTPVPANAAPGQAPAAAAAPAAESDAAKLATTQAGPEHEMKPTIPAPATDSPFGSKPDAAAAPAANLTDGKTPTTLSRSDTTTDAAVQLVKQATLNTVNPGTKIGKALDGRAMCKQVTWRAATDSAGGGNKKLVQYKCELTNFQSVFNQKLAMANAADKTKLTPTEMAQTITFAVDGESVTPQRCRISYQLPNKKNKAFVENPYCLNLAFDSQYTSGWNDVISTVISRAAKS